MTNRLTEGQYYSIIKNKLRLQPTEVSTVYRTYDGDTQNVPDPKRYTPEQRAEIIEKMKARMGITWKD